MWQLLLLTLTLTLTLALTQSNQVCRAWQRLPGPETHEAIEWLRARVRSRVRDRVRVRVRDWVRDSVRDRVTVRVWLTTPSNEGGFPYPYRSITLTPQSNPGP